MSKNHRTLYIVSSDLEILWTLLGIILPKELLEQFRLSIANCLRKMGYEVDWIPESELTEGVRDLLSGCGLRIVSLDKVYARNPEFRIDASRLHYENGEKFPKTGSSTGLINCLEAQVQRIAGRIKETAQDGTSIALVDDVVFFGDLCATIIDLFSKHGLKVRRVYAAVAIGEGIYKVEQALRRFECNGKVKAVRPYGIGIVQDQLCERDFMVAAPYSGRTVAVQPDSTVLPNTGIPYILPWGRPWDWASIPRADAAQFSATCLRLAARIYRELDMKFADLPRNIYGLKIDKDVLVSEYLEDLTNTLFPER